MNVILLSWAWEISSWSWRAWQIPHVQDKVQVPHTHISSVCPTATNLKREHGDFSTIEDSSKAARNQLFTGNINWGFIKLPSQTLYSLLETKNVLRQWKENEKLVKNLSKSSTNCDGTSNMYFWNKYNYYATAVVFSKFILRNEGLYLTYFGYRNNTTTTDL